jgi:hypothetical protein
MPPEDDHWLRRQRHDVAFRTVDRLMRNLGMIGVCRGKRVRTTIRHRHALRASRPIRYPRGVSGRVLDS